MVYWLDISKEQFENLASAGAYFASILTPLSIIGALIAFVKNDKNHKTNMEQFKAQEERALLIDVIKTIDDDLTSRIKQFPINITPVFTAGTGKGNLSYTVYDALFKYSTAGIMENPVLPMEKLKSGIVDFPETEKEQEFDINMNVAHLVEFFLTVTNSINSLKDYCEKHDGLAGNNALGVYYCNKYRLAVIRLKEANYNIDSWESV